MPGVVGVAPGQPRSENFDDGTDYRDAARSRGSRLLADHRQDLPSLWHFRAVRAETVH
jgi:hypothetical protein